MDSFALQANRSSNASSLVISAQERKEDKTKKDRPISLTFFSKAASCDDSQVSYVIGASKTSSSERKAPLKKIVSSPNFSVASSRSETVEEESRGCSDLLHSVMSVQPSLQSPEVKYTQEMHAPSQKARTLGAHARMELTPLANGVPDATLREHAVPNAPGQMATQQACAVGPQQGMPRVQAHDSVLEMPSFRRRLGGLNRSNAVRRRSTVGSFEEVLAESQDVRLREAGWWSCSLQL